MNDTVYAGERNSNWGDNLRWYGVQSEYYQALQDPSGDNMLYALRLGRTSSCVAANPTNS